MDENTEPIRERQEPANPNLDAGESEPDPSDKPEVPPASETWVEGQPTSDADYEDKPTE